MYIIHNAVVLDFLDARLPLHTLYLPLKFQNRLYPLPTKLGRFIYSFLITLHHHHIFYIAFVHICVCLQGLLSEMHHTGNNMQWDNRKGCHLSTGPFQAVSVAGASFFPFSASAVLFYFPFHDFFSFLIFQIFFTAKYRNNEIRFNLFCGPLPYGITHIFRCPCITLHGFLYLCNQDCFLY